MWYSSSARMKASGVSTFKSIFKDWIPVSEVTWKIQIDCCLNVNLSENIYIYKRDCLYLCPSFTREPPYQSPPNFAQTSTPTQGRILTQVWPRQPKPPDPGVPQTPKPKQIMGEKLCFTKSIQMGDLVSFKFSRAVPGPGWLVINISRSTISYNKIIKNMVLKKTFLFRLES